ncbi:CidA/LrgA family protein [Bacillus sp. 1P06AnD]|uniref:CidA/LrgA family protein n=1 Tax=Bacillus sp. 1P06AnD TaxID=3132208 RepID=UPI0039A3865C
MFIKIILQISVLILFSILGNFLHTYAHIPLPGSIIGLILLFLSLSFRLIPISLVEKGSSFLISFFPLLFVPVFIGVMNYSSLLSIKGAILFLLVIVSTIVTMVISGASSQFIERMRHTKEMR